MFTNLISNAITYMGEAAVRRVEIRGLNLGPMMGIEVRDTGPGVPPALREQIFNPYVGVPAFGGSGEVGLGLGLSTVRRLVDAHGGSVGVEANPEGGSLFWVHLPKVS